MIKRVFVTVTNRKPFPVVLIISSLKQLQLTVASWLFMTNIYLTQDEAQDNLFKYQLIQENEVQNNPEDQKIDFLKDNLLQKLAKVKEMSYFTLKIKEKAQQSAEKKKNQAKAKAIDQIGFGIEAVVDYQNQGQDYFKYPYPPQRPQESKKHKYDQEDVYSDTIKENQRKRDIKLEDKNRIERQKATHQLENSVENIIQSGFQGFEEAKHQVNSKNQKLFQCKRVNAFIKEIFEEKYLTKEEFQSKVVDKINEIFGSGCHQVHFNLKTRTKYVFIKCKEGCPFQIWMNHDTQKTSGPPTKLSYFKTVSLNHNSSKH